MGAGSRLCNSSRSLKKVAQSCCGEPAISSSNCDGRARQRHPRKVSSPPRSRRATSESPAQSDRRSPADPAARRRRGACRDDGSAASVQPQGDVEPHLAKGDAWKFPAAGHVAIRRPSPRRRSAVRHARVRLCPVRGAGGGREPTDELPGPDWIRCALVAWVFVLVGRFQIGTGDVPDPPRQTVTRSPWSLLTGEPGSSISPPRRAPRPWSFHSASTSCMRSTSSVRSDPRG